ncbi:hypothetical protein CH333_00180 [candidate division WOR-3 bacterium JGI_Cruoil_03_44_89]|uniref:Smr domain-containing protein n=1 Tax=candidate division WOR-3 bacterium JGI_Cruoil_03_44_89 TaxID=1973748 RepID=A0A235BZJ2_UNCW3|nr:MAG: hypothetical protein CH333_00180 [candidate division WOR-3 bacterium JGI_Cruoil_03_44_89]
MTCTERLEFDKVISLIAQRAGTKRGKHAIEKLSPLNEAEAIERRYAFIREGMEMETPPLYSEENLSAILTNLGGGDTLSPQELLEVAGFLDFLRELRNYFTKNDRWQYLSSLVSSISILAEEKQKITAVVKKDGEIITGRILELEEKLGDSRQRLRDRLGKGVTLRGGRYVIPVKAGKKVDGIVHDISRGGSTLFVEPTDCVPLNNEVEIAAKGIEQEKKRVLRQLNASLSKKLPELKHNLDVLGEYDAIVAISDISRRKGWQIPEVGDRFLRIIGGKHPLLQLKRDVVPLDMEIGRKFTTLLITGPNMGGKTVALQTVGILSIMAQSGIPVPASPDSVFPVFDEIFVDIGDESSIETGESSFSFHLKELKRMQDRAAGKSLLLVDEIDRGTEPDGGRAIASAFLEVFTGKNAITIATSHSTALKFFVAGEDGMQNARMETKNGAPTYRLGIGFPGESLWLETARFVGIDDGLLKRAEELADKNMLKTEHLLRELEEEKGRASELKRKLEEREKNLENQLESAQLLRKKWGDGVERLKKERKKILLEARKRVENLVREIRESNAKRESIVRIKREIEQELKRELGGMKKVETEKRVKNHNFRVGDAARIRSLDVVGRIIVITEKRITLQVDDVRFEIPPESVEPVDKPREVRAESRHHVRFARNRELKGEISIRNLRVDEAIPQLERYIDDVWLLGERNFRIVHGVGKGILKNAVWEFLSKDDRIESFELAPLEEGGDGVTVGKIRL